MNEITKISIFTILLAIPLTPGPPGHGAVPHTPWPPYFSPTNCPSIKKYYLGSQSEWQKFQFSQIFTVYLHLFFLSNRLPPKILNDIKNAFFWLGLRPGWMAHRGGMYGQTDLRTDGKSPHSTELYPLSGPLPYFTPRKLRKGEQGKGTADHLMPLGDCLNVYLLYKSQTASCESE